MCSSAHRVDCNYLRFAIVLTQVINCVTLLQLTLVIDSVISLPISGMRLPSPGMRLFKLAWVRLNRLRAGVGFFRSTMHIWGMSDSAACECDAELQTAL